MKLNKRIAVAALGVLAVGGIGTGVANAATTHSTAPSTSITDTATPGDTPDATTGGVDTPEAGDTPDVAGAAGDTATAGDTPDAPGAVDGGNTQQGDQNTPDAPGAAETPDAPGA